MKYEILIFGLVAALASCGGSANSDGDGHELAENEHEHGDEIEIHDHQAEELGIVTEPAQPEEFAAPVVCTGEIIANPGNSGVVSAPMSGKIVFVKGIGEGSKVVKGQRIATVSTSGMAGGDQLQAARIEYEAAKAEVDRLKPLREEGIVTRGEYNAAVANMERARNAMAGGAGSAVISPVSGVLTSLKVGEGGYVNIGDPVADVLGDGALTLRADIPQREASGIDAAANASVKFVNSADVVEASPMHSSELNASALPGYYSIYYKLPSSVKATVGSFADVYIPTGNVSNVISVPLDAVSDRMGQKVVYVKEEGEEHYKRVPVELGASDGSRVAILSGVNPGDLVVTKGVTFVRLAENAGATPPGHTHNH